MTAGIEKYRTITPMHRTILDEDVGREDQLLGQAEISAEIILIFELTGDFDLVSEPVVFVSMRSIRNGRSNITGTVKRPLC